MNIRSNASEIKPKPSPWSLKALAVVLNLSFSCATPNSVATKTPQAKGSDESAVACIRNIHSASRLVHSLLNPEQFLVERILAPAVVGLKQLWSGPPKITTAEQLATFRAETTALKHTASQLLASPLVANLLLPMALRAGLHFAIPDKDKRDASTFKQILDLMSSSGASLSTAALKYFATQNETANQLFKWHQRANAATLLTLAGSESLHTFYRPNPASDNFDKVESMLNFLDVVRTVFNEPAKFELVENLLILPAVKTVGALILSKIFRVSATTMIAKVPQACAQAFGREITTGVEIATRSPQVRQLAAQPGPKGYLGKGIMLLGQDVWRVTRSTLVEGAIPVLVSAIITKALSKSGRKPRATAGKNLMTIKSSS